MKIFPTHITNNLGPDEAEKTSLEVEVIKIAALHKLTQQN